MDEKTKTDIRNQIEYYLSDGNLEGDQFFHDLISKDKDGYLNLDYILQCNLIKKSKWTKEQIIESLKESDKVELNSDKTKIRRKGNKPLPPLNEEKLLTRKRNREKNNKKDKKPLIILTIVSDKETEIKWQDIESKYKSLNPELNIIYTRFNKNEGNFGIMPVEENDDEEKEKETGKDKEEKEKSELNYIKEFNIDDIKFKVNICEGKELDKFMEENKSHLDLCLKQTKNKKKKKKKTKTILNNAVSLGDEEFNDIAKIKEKIKKIMDEVKDEMVVLDEQQTKFIKDLVKFHPDKKIRKKTEEIEFIGVGKLKENEYKKGFFGLNEKKEKMYDFLIYKCPERIMTEDRKNSK